MKNRHFFHPIFQLVKTSMAGARCWRSFTCCLLAAGAAIVQQASHAETGAEPGVVAIGNLVPPSKIWEGFKQNALGTSCARVCKLSIHNYLFSTHCGGN